MIIDNIWMIRPPIGAGESIHQAAIATWENEKTDYELNFFDSITPLDIEDPEMNLDYIQFGRWWGHREFDPLEQAWFYTHAELWRKCIETDETMVIVSPNAACCKPDGIDMDDDKNVQPFAAFMDDEDWDLFSEGYRDHPFWGEENKFCPTGIAYGITPAGAKKILKDARSGPVDLSADELLLLHAQRERADIIGYCTPVIFKMPPTEDDFDDEAAQTDLSGRCR